MMNIKPRPEWGQHVKMEWNCFRLRGFFSLIYDLNECRSVMSIHYSLIIRWRMAGRWCGMASMGRPVGWTTGAIAKCKLQTKMYTLRSVRYDTITCYRERWARRYVSLQSKKCKWPTKIAQFIWSFLVASGNYVPRRRFPPTFPFIVHTNLVWPIAFCHFSNWLLFI